MPDNIQVEQPQPWVSDADVIVLAWLVWNWAEPGSLIGCPLFVWTRALESFPAARAFAEQLAAGGRLANASAVMWFVSSGRCGGAYIDRHKGELLSSASAASGARRTAGDYGTGYTSGAAEATTVLVRFFTPQEVELEPAHPSVLRPGVSAENLGR